MAGKVTALESATEDEAPESDRGGVQKRVYDEISRNLIVGTFFPGEKVTLRKLAEQVGTSITPVRVAVNRLVAEGAFQVLPNHWLQVPVMTKDKFEEITHWRIMLESDAVKRACQHADKKLIGDLTSINRGIVESVKRGDRSNLLSINYEFHFTIYRAAQSDILVPMIESLWLRAGPFTYYSLNYSMNSHKELWDARHHNDILDALKDRDTSAAVAAIKRDILSTASALRETSYYQQPTLKRVALARV